MGNAALRTMRRVRERKLFNWRWRSQKAKHELEAAEAEAERKGGVNAVVPDDSDGIKVVSASGEESRVFFSEEVDQAGDNPRWVVKINRYDRCGILFAVADAKIKHAQQYLEDDPGAFNPALFAN